MLVSDAFVVGSVSVAGSPNVNEHTARHSFGIKKRTEGSPLNRVISQEGVKNKTVRSN